MKKLSLYVFLGLMFCNVAVVASIFDKNKSRDYNFICTFPNKALKNDWSQVLNKFGFSRFGSDSNKILIFSSWNKQGNHYNFPIVEVEKRVSDDEDIELRYYWHNIYNPITYKNGEKGPIIHSNILSKYRKHDRYYLEELFIKISKDKYETLKRFEDDAFQFAGKDEKSYISAIQRNKKIIQNLSVKSYNEGNLDKEFGLACRIE